MNYSFTRCDSGDTFGIGVVIVLNGWWLGPAWFCYSLQLERLPTMTAMRRHHCTDLSLPLDSANAGQLCYLEWCSIAAQLPPIYYQHYIAVLARSFLSTQLKVFQFFIFHIRYFSLNVFQWTDVYFHKGSAVRAGFLFQIGLAIQVAVLFKLAPVPSAFLLVPELSFR